VTKLQGEQPRPGYFVDERRRAGGRVEEQEAAK